jgi:hypothetical protein
MKSLLALLLLTASAVAAACPVCLSSRPSAAQQLGTLQQVVLAVPASGGYRVVDTVKGTQRPGTTLDGASVRIEAAVTSAGKPLLLARDDAWSSWVLLGTIGAEHAGFLREIAAGDPARRAARMVRYLEHIDPLAAELAYGEIAAAPYATLLSLKPRLSAPAIRRWLADPDLASRQPLYLLLLGVAGDARDAAWLERRLDAAWTAGDAANLGAMIVADLELRGAHRVTWVDQRYLTDRKRSSREVEAALAALSVHGNASTAIPRERVIRSYRLFMKERPEIAGYVAQDFAAWRYWDAVPDYLALLHSPVRQQYPSRLAVVAYLRQSPNGRSLELPSH